MIFKRTKPESLDSILAGFNSITAKLEKFLENTNEAIVNNNIKIRELQDSTDALSKAEAKARQTNLNIKNLIEE